MIIGDRNFDTNKGLYIMGILNVTPDSFSDGGNYNNLDAAIKHAGKMIEDGADIIDVGGESTRPGYTLISEEEEIKRVVPVIRELKVRFQIPISIDTYKAKVAKAAIEAGADLVNDIWGLKYDSDMAKVIAKANVSCCLMHNRKESLYEDYLTDVMSDLAESIEIAKKAGIAEDKIMLDPGVGFAKSYEQNLEIINNVDKLKKLGYPVLLGTSRKSVIGLTLDVPSDKRMVGTVATTVIGAMKGCSFFRVHDIVENKQALMMTGAVCM